MALNRAFNVRNGNALRPRVIALGSGARWMDWLQGEQSAEAILRPFGGFKVSGPKAAMIEDLFEIS